MDLGLTDRACVVTGGARGIGRAITRRLIAEGARVLITGRTPDRLDAATAQLGERGHGLDVLVDSADNVVGAAWSIDGGAVPSIF